MPQNAALSRKFPYNSILVLKFQHCATLLALEGVVPRELWVVIMMIMMLRTAMMPIIVGVTEPQRAVAANGNACARHLGTPHYDGGKQPPTL
jgi:hypothetical protein